MRSRGGTLICAVFAFVLLGSWVTGSVGSTLENRRPAAFPQRELRTVLDASTYRQIDLALKDRLGLRDRLIPRVGRLGVALGLSLNSKVHIGADEELFTTEDFTLPCEYLDRFDAAETADRLRRWQQVASANGKQVLYTIAPDKSTVQRADIGPDANALMRCSDRVRRDVREAWGRSGDDIMLLLWDDLAVLEKEHPRLSYQEGDGHWTQVGAAVLLDRIVNLVSEGRIDPDNELAPTGSWNRPGALYRQLGYSDRDTVPVIKIRRPGVTTRQSVIQTRVPPHNRRFQSTSTKTPLLPGRTLLVHDSFANALQPMLKGYFTDITFMHWEDYGPAAKAKKLPPFDRIIFESVERGFARRAVENLPDPRIEAGLLDALGSQPAAGVR